MTDTPAGQGEGEGTTSRPVTQTPTGNNVELDTLRSELEQARVTIDRLRGTQSSNDRELGRLRTRESELLKSVQDFEAASDALRNELQTERTEKEALNTRLGELSGAESLAASAREEAERLRLAAVMAGTTPAISLLVETNALPQTENLEQFKEALARISNGIVQVTDSAARNLLTGSRPETQSTGKPTKEGLFAQYDALLKQGKFDEAMKAYTQALELKE